MSRHYYTRNSEKTIIRPLEEGDIEILRKIRNENPSVFLRQRAEISVEQQKKWYQKEIEATDSITWAIDELAHPGIIVGSVSLFNITGENAEFGHFMISEHLRGRGMGQEVLEGVLSVAFRDLKLQTVYLHCDMENDAALHAYKSIGFQVKRQQVRQGNIIEYIMECRNPEREEL